MKFCIKQWLLREYGLGAGLDKLTNVWNKEPSQRLMNPRT